MAAPVSLVSARAPSPAPGARAGLLALGVLAASLASGCAENACKAEPASFELEVSAAAGVARVISALEVDVEVSGATFRKRYPIATQLTDSVTSLGVRVEPAPTADFSVRVRVRGLDGDGQVRAEGSTTISATPDGCNRGALALTVAAPADGGLADTGPRPDAEADAGVAPDAEPDAGEAPDAEPDAGVEPDTGIPPDSGVAPDSGVPPDTGVPPDSGVHPDAAAPDAMAPDVGGTPFSYVPSNFEPGRVAVVVPRVQLNCGETVFDSTAGTFTNDCGRTMPTMVLSPQPGGTTAALLAFAGLDILPGSALRVVGDKPVILAVFGNATIAGRLDARGNLSTPGAGGNNGADCLSSAGAPPGAGLGGGGGGSYSTLGTSGGTSGASGGTAGGTSGVAPLVPLRGGCSGGRGAGATPGAGGGGGGAIQVSAAGTLSVPGEVNAGGGGGSPGGASSGGGGGASGGGILLEGRSVVVVGTVVANGGGGGGGGNAGGPGSRGNDGATSPASGGMGAGGGGNGGNGATRTSLATAGGNGAGQAGGGGGAGGLGRVRINATMCNVGGSISPAHTGCP